MAHEIEFRGVSFAYENEAVLKDISFTANKGQLIALIGSSGSGKTTIANLLARFWDISEGEILVRGKNIQSIPMASLMGMLSMVFQKVYLFEDTVYNNIAMGRPGATQAEVIEAARKARCYDFIMELPYGFETVIGAGGASFLEKIEAEKVGLEDNITEKTREDKVAVKVGNYYAVVEKEKVKDISLEETGLRIYPKKITLRVTFTRYIVAAPLKKVPRLMHFLTRWLQA